MIGYFPVLAVLLKSLLNKFRGIAPEGADDRPTTVFATEGAMNADVVDAATAARREKLNNFIVVDCLRCCQMQCYVGMLDEVSTFDIFPSDCPSATFSPHQILLLIWSCADYEHVRISKRSVHLERKMDFSKMKIKFQYFLAFRE